MVNRSLQIIILLKRNIYLMFYYEKNKRLTPPIILNMAVLWTVLMIKSTIQY